MQAPLPHVESPGLQSAPGLSGRDRGDPSQPDGDHHPGIRLRRGLGGQALCINGKLGVYRKNSQGSKNLCLPWESVTLILGGYMG